MNKLRQTKSYSDLSDTNKISFSRNLSKDKSDSTRTLDGKGLPDPKYLLLSRCVVKDCIHYLSFIEQYSKEIFLGMCKHIISPNYGKGKLFKVSLE